MTGDLVPRGIPQPEVPAWRRTRAQREQLRAAALQAELARLQAVTDAHVARIQAGGRAQLHSDRSRYTSRLTREIAENFVETHQDMGHLLDGEPFDQGLTIALAQIEATSLAVQKSHLEDHRRDGRDWFGRW